MQIATVPQANPVYDTWGTYWDWQANAQERGIHIPEYEEQGEDASAADYQEQESLEPDFTIVPVERCANRELGCRSIQRDRALRLASGFAQSL